MAEGGSDGGYQAAGAYVNWTLAGVTGAGWPTQSGINSPFEGMTYTWQEGDAEDTNDILYIISRDTDLDSVFLAWSQKYLYYHEQEVFLSYAKSTYGLTPSGCIGDQL